jgi:hypothetical protein
MPSQKQNPYGKAKFVALGVATAGLMVAAWFFMLRPQPDKAAAEPKGFLYRYCPECGNEITCAPIEADQQIACPRCAKLGKRNLFQVSDYSHANSAAIPRPDFGWRIAFVLAVPIVMAGVLIYYRKTQKGPEKEEEEEYSFSCPGCFQRLKYRKSRVGEQTLCPVCKERLTFPAPRRKRAAARPDPGLGEWKAQAASPARRSSKGSADHP